MAEHKGGKRDRTGKGLKRARWNIDNEPPNLPQPNELQMPDKRLNMPVSLKRRSGVECSKASFQKGMEISAKDQVNDISVMLSPWAFTSCAAWWL
jgi:hypothetical protein